MLTLTKDFHDYSLNFVVTNQERENVYSHFLQVTLWMGPS